LDGELCGTEMMAVRSHLHRCDACAEEAESLRSLKSALSRLSCCEPPEDLECRLLLAVKDVSRPAIGGSRRSLLWGSALIGAAAAGFLFVWLGVLGAAEPQVQAPDATVANQSTSIDMARDRAIFSGADPLSGQTMAMPAVYENGR
jgi:anti-sigma factor RsiW